MARGFTDAALESHAARIVYAHPAWMDWRSLLRDALSDAARTWGWVPRLRRAAMLHAPAAEVEAVIAAHDGRAHAAG